MLQGSGDLAAMPSATRMRRLTAQQKHKYTTSGSSAGQAGSENKAADRILPLG